MTLPPHVSAFKDRHGKTRYRFRRKGTPGMVLPAPDDLRFEAAYATALAGGAPRKGRFDPKTLAAAWAEVCTSAEWRKLKPSSQDMQRRVAERFLTTPVAQDDPQTFGQLPFAGISRGVVKRIIGRYENAFAAESILRLLRKLCLVALDNEWIEIDPTYKVKGKAVTKGHRAWLDSELRVFEARWPIGTNQRLGFALALYTGQRRGDVAAMTWAAYDGQGIAVTQAKTGAPLWIPVHPALHEILTTLTPDDGTILKTQSGAPYVNESFGNLMADAIDAAGLPAECRLHGLRKAAGRSLAEAGATTRQIMAVLGHSTLSEAERYTRDVEQRRLAQEGMDSWARPKFAVVKNGK